MRIDYNQIKKLPVKTVSGQYLGKVKNLEIDVDNHQIIKYYVGVGFLSKNLLIASGQVKSITTKVILVEDLLDKSTETVDNLALPKAANPVIESEKN